MSGTDSLDSDLLDDAVSGSAYANAAMDNDKQFASESKHDEQETPQKVKPEKSGKLFGLLKKPLLIGGGLVLAFGLVVGINTFKASQPATPPASFVDSVTEEPALDDAIFEGMMDETEAPPSEQETVTTPETDPFAQQEADSFNEPMTDDVDFDAIDSTDVAFKDEAGADAFEAELESVSEPITTDALETVQSLGVESPTASFVISEELSTTLKSIDSRLAELEKQPEDNNDALLFGEITKLSSQIAALSKTVESLRQASESLSASVGKPVQIAPKHANEFYIPPTLTWLSWVKDRGIALVDGTMREISIEPREQLKGRGIVKSVTEKGCIIFEVNPSYAPENGSC